MKMASDKLLAFLNMTEEELEKTMDQFASKMVEEQHQKIRTMYEQRHTLLPTIFEHLKEKGSIDGDDLAYFPDHYAFTSKEFQDFFSLVTDYLEEEHGYAVDEDCGFENKTFILRYEGVLLEFFIMWGQGTCTILKISEEQEECPVELIGSFDKWILYMEKEYETVKETIEKNKSKK